MLILSLLVPTAFADPLAVLSESTLSTAAVADARLGSVSLSGDRLLVGAYGEDGKTGATYVYELDGETWVEVARLVASDGAADDFAGYAVSLDGDRALVSAHFDDDEGDRSGSVYVFEVDGAGAWTQTAKLTASDGGEKHLFGMSLSLDGDRALVGARGADAAYIFDFDGAEWTETEILVAADAGVGEKFGSAVSLEANRALVGAYADTENGHLSGAAYVFDLDSGSWTETAKLMPSDATTYHYFGISVSLSGTRVLAGAVGDGELGANSGAGYLFVLEGGEWAEEAKLLADEGAGNDQFGGSVQLSGERAALGGQYANSTGQALVFDQVDESWQLVAELGPSDGVASDAFGSWLSLGVDRLAVGAPLATRDAQYEGRVYVYQFAPANTPPWVEVNAGLTLANGAVAEITATALLAADVESGPDELVFTVLSGPAHGTLSMDSFTQGDVDSGAVSYSHDGSQTTDDGFDFTLSDAGGLAVDGRFVLAITEEDPGGDDTEGAVDDSGEVDDKPDDSGCSTAPSPWGFGLALLGLCVLRRRRQART
jgi:MYXO-CTERM domain-containing protein